MKELDLGRRHALVVVDMQRDFFNDSELARCRDDLVAACNRLIDAALDIGAPVFDVRTVHRADRSTWSLNMHEDGAGMTVEGTAGVERVAGLHEGTEIIHKTRDSAFHRTALADRLRELGSDIVLLCGVSTESCIAATATDAYAHDLRVIHVADAEASIDWNLHERTLALLHDQYRQPRASTDEVLASLTGAAGAPRCP
ncbi:MULTISPECIES: cysteine hydrolase family protein [unclassified Nocardioides]|uniref:cysteine hydrolase family protein n=1 Tax=unclassified Nocardioides TaxID=2615069 RepID=UPI003014278C